jgi:hypothetical protein
MVMENLLMKNYTSPVKVAAIEAVKKANEVQKVVARVTAARVNGAQRVVVQKVVAQKVVAQKDEVQKDEVQKDEVQRVVKAKVVQASVVDPEGLVGAPIHRVSWIMSWSLITTTMDYSVERN